MPLLYRCRNDAPFLYSQSQFSKDLLNTRHCSTADLQHLPTDNPPPLAHHIIGRDHAGSPRTANTASALAPTYFRAGPLDPTHRSVSAPTIDVGRLHSFAEAAIARGPSPLSSGEVFGRDLIRSTSTSSQPAFHATFLNEEKFHNRSASLSIGRNEYLQDQQPFRPALPALSTLTSLVATPPQRRSYSSDVLSSSSSISYRSTPPMPIPTPTVSGNQPPVCQNCSTSTTPLWRRDEGGSVLCNACGLFLKLHGRTRPISLKTDVIKSRNRVKSNQGPRKRIDQPSLPASLPNFDALRNGIADNRRISNIANSEHSHSPISRTGSPSLHADPNIAPQHIFDHVTLNDNPELNNLPTLNLGHPSPGSDRLEPPLPYERLLQDNAALRTRVSELEVIHMVMSDNENNLRNERDNALRRIAELEEDLRKSREERADEEHPSKKVRLSDEDKKPPGVDVSQ